MSDTFIASGRLLARASRHNRSARVIISHQYYPTPVFTGVGLLLNLVVLKLLLPRHDYIQIATVWMFAPHIDYNQSTDTKAYSGYIIHALLSIRLTSFLGAAAGAACSFLGAAALT